MFTGPFFRNTQLGSQLNPMPKSLTRKMFATSLLLIAVFGVLQSTGQTAIAQQSGPQTAASKQRPNILILMTDDMSRRCVTATGGKQAITPNIDALARRGTVMQNTVHQGAFSGAICTCSRARY